MGELADGDVVDAGLADAAGDLEREPAARFEHDAGRPFVAEATAAGISSMAKLSSITTSAPASRASASASIESTSISTGNVAANDATAANASATPPAAITWLSLTRAASDRPIRWLAPPPIRTAYFSSARSPGIVLRVSRTIAAVPARASAHRRVSVATPERWQSRLSADRSAVSNRRVGAVTRATSVPGDDPLPVVDEIVEVGCGRAADRLDHGGSHRQAGDDTVTARRRTSPRCAGSPAPSPPR